MTVELEDGLASKSNIAPKQTAADAKAEVSKPEVSKRTSDTRAYYYCNAGCHVVALQSPVAVLQPAEPLHPSQAACLQALLWLLPTHVHRPISPRLQHRYGISR